MKKFWGVVSVFILALPACGPRDVAVESGRGGFSTNSTPGKPATFEKAGERPSTCPAKNSNYSYLFDTGSDFDKVFTGDVYANVTAGDLNCFVIGSEVSLQNPRNAAPEIRDVKVKVTKVEIIAAANVGATHGAALGLSASEAKSLAEKVVADAVAAAKFQPRGMVSITYFELVQSTVTAGAVEQGTTTNPVAPVTTTPVGTVAAPIMLYASEGDRSVTCPVANTDYDFLSSTPETAPLMVEGQITAVMSVGDRNCYRIGSALKFRDEKANPSAPAFVITQVHIVPVEKLNALHAKGLNMTLQELKDLAAAQVAKAVADGKFDPKNTVTVTFFEKVAQ